MIARVSSAAREYFCGRSGFRRARNGAYSARAWKRQPLATCTSSMVRVCQSALSRSEEHTSELQSLMRISYAVFCLKKKKKIRAKHSRTRKYPNKESKAYIGNYTIINNIKKHTNTTDISNIKQK